MIHTYVTFDPRTKMLLLMTMAIFVLGGAGDKLFGAYLPLFCLLPFVLFILVGKWKRANRIHHFVQCILFADSVCLCLI